MGKISQLFKIMSGKELTEENCAWFLVCLKLSRESTKHKKDNLVDIAGYVGLIDELIDDENRKKPVSAVARIKGIPESIINRRKYGLVSALDQDRKR